MRRFAFAFALLALGCPSDPGPSPASAPTQTSTEPSTQTRTSTQTPAAGSAVEIADREVPVHCGCALPEVGRCSEWADLDGKRVKLLDHGLGSMPFCRKEGLRARVSGQLAGDELRVSRIEVLPAR